MSLETPGAANRASGDAPRSELRAVVATRVRRFGRVLMEALRESVRDRITMSAGSLAFHLFLAVFPAAVAAIGLAGLLHLSPGELRHLVHGLGVLLPTQMSAVLTQALTGPNHAGTSQLELALGVVAALWSAIEATASLQVALDVACEVTSDRGFLGRRLMALPLVLATLVLGSSASVLMVLGNPIRRLLPRQLPLVQPAFGVAWDVLRYGGAAILVMILLSTYYSLGPNRSHPRWRWISAGSVVAGAVWLVSSAVFAFYLDHFGHESRTYGTFAGVAILALWMYLSANAVLFGAELDTEIERNTGSEPDAPADCQVDAEDSLRVRPRASFALASRAFLRRVLSCFQRTVDRAPRPITKA